jgi:DNA-binding MarR family transcriptional regulator
MAQPFRLCSWVSLFSPPVRPRVILRRSDKDCRRISTIASYLPNRHRPHAALPDLPHNFCLDNSCCNDNNSTMDSRAKDSCRSVTLEEQLFVAILKVADSLTQDAEQLIKSSGLTGAQYNVLRILRGAEPGGLPCSGIAERMISHDPDMTRLLDRMEKRNLITRQRQKDDRRVVKTHVTEEGLALLKTLDIPVRERHKRQFQHLNQSRLKALAQLLAELGNPEST